MGAPVALTSPCTLQTDAAGAGHDDTMALVVDALDTMQAAAAQATADLQRGHYSPQPPTSPREDEQPQQTRALDIDASLGLDTFFATPPPPAIMPGPEVPRQVQVRRRRTYDMSKVCRSARLARKPVMPALMKAQINLCRQLGLVEAERKPIEEVLVDYINMYSGPLPQHIVAALTTFFGIHDELEI